MLPEDSSSSRTSCFRGSTKPSRQTSIKSSTGHYRGFNMVQVIAVILIFLATVNSVPYGRTHQRTIRLCSKSLSDALYLICHDRGGYNEPFSYSGEDARRTSTGPGLVEECCYHPCSYEQLEQYCKPISNDKTKGNNSQDGIEESLRIVNLPEISIQEVGTERRAVTSEKNADKSIKSKQDRNLIGFAENSTTPKRRKHDERLFKETNKQTITERRKRFRGHGNARYCLDDKPPDNNIDRATDRNVYKTTTHPIRRIRPSRHSRHCKAEREDSIVFLPKFNVGTTVPESRHSLLIFPSRTNLVIQRMAKGIAEVHDYEKLEKY